MTIPTIYLLIRQPLADITQTVVQYQSYLIMLAPIYSIDFHNHLRDGIYDVKIYERWRK